MEKVIKNTPLVSVIMPVYNAEKYLEEAIKSVLSQTFTNFEFLIFNDGSTDNSLKIIQSYQDDRIVLAYNGQNKGYVSHLNEGIRLARGKYIARMDADDICLPERFEKQVDFLEKNPTYVLCGSRIKCFGETQDEVMLPLEDEEIRLKMLYITPFAHPSVMIRKATLLENALRYDKEVMPAEDHDLWARIAQLGKLHNLKTPLLRYRMHPQNISTQKRTPKQIINLAKSEQKYISYFFSEYNLSSAEVCLLHLMFHRREDVNIEQIQNILAVVKKIESKPILHQGIDKKSIVNLLREKFFYLCTTSTHLGLPVWNLYNTSKLSGEGISLGLKAKFFLKSLLKYRSVTK